MERIKHNQTPEDDECVKDVSFSQVSSVATDWMLDFLFISLCRKFKEENLDEFNQTLSSFEALADNQPQNEKVLICAFLARVMHGKELDVFFEDDEKVFPLMSAANLWRQIRQTVEDESLARTMTLLLIVQSVAVCLEKGANAHYALQWLENNLDIPSSLRIKLGTVVSKMDNYHPLLKCFSYRRLLETTQMFLNAFLEKNPSDYLLKVATEAVRSSGSRDTLTDTKIKKSPKTESAPAGVNRESKRKPLLSKKSDMWIPESCKKPFVCLTRISQNVESTLNTKSTAMETTTFKKRKPRTKWTYAQDKQLMEGIRRHGLGQWSRILLDFDFEGRTGTMLKDRWRILKKI